MKVSPEQRWPLPGNPHATIGTKQHLLPQFLQRYFGNDHGRIATLDRESGRRHVAAIHDTGTERDFYTTMDEAGAKDGRSDHLLGYIEARAAPVVKELVTLAAFARFPPTVAARTDLCLFLAFQMTRGRATRRIVEMAGDIYAHAMIPPDMSADQAEELLRAHGETPTPEDIAQLQDLSAHMQDFEALPDPNAHISVMGTSASGLLPELVLRRWYVAEYPAPALVTCDEPVVLVFDDQGRVGRRGGIRYAREVWFPLSPRHLLVLAADDRYGPQRRLAALPGSAPGVNRRIAANAYEAIYQHPDHDHLAGIDIPPRGPLFTVHAPGVPGAERYNRPPSRTKTRRR